MRTLAIEGERATSDALNTLRRGRDTESLEPGDLAALVRASADRITVLDNDHRVVYANPAACELLGYPLDRMLGLDVLKLIPERERQTALTALANARRGQSQAVTGIASGSDRAGGEAQGSPRADRQRARGTLGLWLDPRAGARRLLRARRGPRPRSAGCATSVGPRGGEVLSMLALAVQAEVPVASLRGMITAYPTFYPGIQHALRELASQ